MAERRRTTRRARSTTAVLVLLALSVTGPRASAGTAGPPSRGPLPFEEDHVAFGVGFFASPRPYAEARGRAFPIPIADLRRGPWFAQGLRFGYDLLRKGAWRASLFGEPRFMGYAAKDSPRLAGMDGRGNGLDAGIALELRAIPVSARVDWRTDVLGRSGGQEASLAVLTGVPLGRFLLLAAYGPQWQSGRLVDYYYGVRDEEAREGRPAYRPGPSLNWRWTLTGLYRADERWTLLAVYSRTRFGAPIRESPLVDRDGVGVLFTAVAFGWR